MMVENFYVTAVNGLDVEIYNSHFLLDIVFLEVESL